MEKRVSTQDEPKRNLRHTYTVYTLGPGESVQDLNDTATQEGFTLDNLIRIHDLTGPGDHREAIEAAQQTGYTLVKGQYQEVFHRAAFIS